jgi:hypothetical protein
MTDVQKLIERIRAHAHNLRELGYSYPAASMDEVPAALEAQAAEIAELREALKPAEDTLDFGDFVLIEQKRHGVENEWYVYKVIGRHHSNAWVDVPVQTPATTALHQDMEEVVSCICCGVSETEVRRYRLTDVHRTKSERFGQTPRAKLEGSGA